MYLVFPIAQGSHGRIITPLFTKPREKYAVYVELMLSLWKTIKPMLIQEKCTFLPPPYYRRYSRKYDPSKQYLLVYLITDDKKAAP